MISKATEGHVIPELERLVSKLDKSLIEFDGNLRLIFIEEIGGNVGNSLNITVLKGKSLLVVQMRFLNLVQLVIYSTNSNV